MSDRQGGAETRRYSFLLVPQFTLLAYSSAIDPLRMANQLSNRELYTWRTLSTDGEPVASSCGVRIPADGSLDDDPQATAVFVCGGMDVQRTFDPRVLPWLRKLANRKLVLGALCTGSYVLAEAKLLKGYRCTIHWENFAGIRERHPDLVISQELFEIDRDRYTCAGGIAPMDMMLHLIRRHHGSDLATAVSEQFVCDRIRDNHDRQRVPLRHRIGTSQPKLMEAVSLMEANIEEPMALDELSQHIGLSRRQLERLFKKYLNCVPTRYYLQIRLERARQLLLQTSMPIVDTALACGFISAPHFSKCYRLVFGVPPREERRRAATGQQLN